MPVVPKFRGGQVAPAPIPGARLSAHETAESLGANVSQQEARTAAVASGVLTNAAETATGLYVRQQAERRREVEDIRARANHLAVVKSETDLGRFEVDALDAATALKGQAALEVPEKGMAAFRKRADQIANGLSTPEQKQAFEIVRAKRELNFHSTLAAHTAREMQAYEANELQASKLNALAAGATYARVTGPEGPRLIADELARAESSTFALEVSQGAGPEKIKAALLNTQTQFHAGVVSELMAQGRVGDARSYFTNANQANQIETTVADKLNDDLNQQTELKRAQQELDRITAATSDPTKRREMAKEIGDDPTGRVRQLVTQMVNEQNSEDAQQFNRQQRQHQQTLIDTIDQAKDNPRLVLPLADLMRMPAFLALDTAAERASITNYRAMRAAGQKPETDLDSWESLARLSQADPVKFSNLRMGGYKDKLSESDYKHFVALQLAAKDNAVKQYYAGLARTSGTDPLVRSTFNLTWQAFTNRDPDDDLTKQADRNKDPQYETRLASMRRLVADEVERASAVKGATLTETEIRQTTERVFAQTVTKLNVPMFFGTATAKSIRLFELKVGDIPEVEKSLILKAMEAAGLPTNDEREILRRYFVRLGKR